MKRAVVAVAATMLVTLGGAGRAAAVSLTYYGGPVAHSMNVVLVYWGSQVRSTYTNVSTGDPAFFGYLASQSGSASDIGGVLAQYLDTTSTNSANKVSYGGAFQLAPSVGAVPPGTVNDSDIQSQLVSGINGHQLPAPSGSGLSTIYVVLFPPGDRVCDPTGICSDDVTSGFCAYHGSFPLTGSTHVLYAAMVDNGPGTANYGGCGPLSATDIANQTDVTSHEFAEAINDPLVAEAGVLGPPLAWYDNASNGGEIADLCATGDVTEQTPNGPWTVQKVWSNVDGACVGAESVYAQPTASFTSSLLGGAGAAFSAIASVAAGTDHTSVGYNGVTYSISSGIASYDWNWGDGSAHGSGVAPIHTYATPGTYNVTLTVTDDMGFTASTTHQVTVATPLAPTATTGTVDSISYQGATLHGSINPYGQAVSYRFAYGTDPGNLGFSAAVSPGPTGILDTPVSDTISSGLSPSTTYYYRLDVLSGGAVYSGAVRSFVTNARPAVVQTPVAGTGGATGIGISGAVLNGTVNPGGPAGVQYRFAYGLSPGALDQGTAVVPGGSGTVAQPVSVFAGGLIPHTTYFFRLEIVLAGHIYSGSVQSFVTRAPLPGASTRGARVRGVTVTLHGRVNPHGFATDYYFQLGRTRVYGKSSPRVAVASADGAIGVSATIAGLRPHRTYHYQLVAISVGGTVVGTDRRFRTGAGRLHAPLYMFGAVPGQTLSGAVSHGLVVRFVCARSCLASATATSGSAAGGRIRDVGGAPLTLARGTAVLRGGRSGLVRLHFTRRFVGRAGGLRSIALILTGVVAAPDGSSAVPQRVRVVLAR